MKAEVNVHYSYVTIFVLFFIAFGVRLTANFSPGSERSHF
jgi:hypothetical protein